MGTADDQAEMAGKTGGAPPVLKGGNRRRTGGEPPDNCDASARDGFGRFVRGTAAGAATRYAKGRSGNPAGRPKGTFRSGSGRFRAGTLAAAALLDARAELIAGKAVELALAGDPVAVRFCLGRILGVRRGQPVELDLAPVAAPGDLAAAVAAVTGAVAAGQITPDEALSLAQMLDGLPRVFAAVPPPPPANGDDPRKTLARKLARLAKRVEQDALEQARAPARGSPPAPLLPKEGLDAAVAEQQEQHQDDQQQPANADPAAIAVTRIAPAAAAEQQEQQHDQDDKAHFRLHSVAPGLSGA